MRTKKKHLGLIIAICLVTLGCIAAVLWNAAGSLFPVTATQKMVWNYATEHGYFYGSYPQSLIDLLERNPETEQFVLQFPEASKKEYTIDLSGYEDPETVPLFLQWDQQWGYITYGNDVAGLTGCGPVSLSMAAFYLSGGSSDYTPEKIIEFAIENHYYVPGSGSSWSLISKGGELLGFQVTELPLDENRIQSKLEAGIPIICVMGPGDFTTSGHFLVLTGYENGKIILNDPNSMANSQKLWTYEQLKPQIKNLWSIENN